MIMADGTKSWYRYGELHRENDRPAIERADGSKEWWRNGKRHRDTSQPAVIGPANSTIKEYWINGTRMVSTMTTQPNGDEMWATSTGLMHREDDLPAYVTKGGRGKTWFIAGRCHRDGDKPAAEHGSGLKEWFRNGRRHRDGDEPAAVWPSGTKEWWRDGVLYRADDKPQIEWELPGMTLKLPTY